MISKMVLIPFEKLKTLETNATPYQPVLTTVSQQPSITTTAKLVRQRAMRKKRLFKRNSATIKKEISADNILRGLPVIAHRKALNLLKHMKKTGDRLKWDPKSGEISFDGSTVPGSNIEELVRNITSREKTKLHPGWQTFARGLNETEVPENAIGTLKKLETLKSTVDWGNLKWMIN